MKKIIITLAALLIAAPAFASWPTPVDPNGPNSGAGRDIMLPQGETSGAGRALASVDMPSQGEISAGRSKSLASAPTGNPPQGELTGRSIA